MWNYEKRLQYPVKIARPNPKLAKAIMSQMGGPDGEIAASLRYLSQRYAMPYAAGKAILTDIGTEELAHMEIVSAMLHQLTRCSDEKDLEKGGNGYLPIPLQYRPYTADAARSSSLAGGDFREKSADRSYRGKTETVCNEQDLDNILEMRRVMKGKPVIVLMELHHPVVPAEFEAAADGIAVQFGVSRQAVFDVLFGRSPARGKLPYHLPRDMETVEKHCEDVFDDYEPYTDSAGNVYARGFGLSF